MKSKYSYAYQHLRETIYALAIGPEDIRKRLSQVYQGLFTLKKEHFPEILQSDWEWVQKELKRYGPLKKEDGSIFLGSVEHTCSRIKKKTGVKIAKKMLDMYLYINMN